VMKPVMPKSNGARDSTVAGNIAGICKVIFPPEDSLESATGPWLQGLLPSRDGDWPFEGISACLWHGGSELVDGTSTCLPKELKRHDPPHCKCSSNTPTSSAENIFIVIRREYHKRTNPFAAMKRVCGSYI